jgi:5-methyltetrahydropteroyltriglutamate--homocysteine methyltransferase
VNAFRLATAAVSDATQIHTHMCYSDFTEIVREIDAMDADVITFEAARSNMEILDYLVQEDFQTAVGPGLYDIHSPRVPSEEEIESSIRTILRKTGKDGRSYQGLWVNPDCGLKTRTSSEAEASLRNLVAATRKVRASYHV